MARKRRLPAAKPSFMGRIKTGLYSGVIGLGLLIGASYFPSSMAHEHPLVQRMLDVAVEVRQWAFQAVVDTGALTGGDLRGVLEWLPEKVREGLPTFGEADYTPMPAGSPPRTAASWNLARRALYEHVHYDRRETLYCGCSYNANNQVNP